MKSPVSTSPTVPHPSLSRDIPLSTRLPRLVHSLHEQRNSVLSLSADARHIYSGSQRQDISVWDKKTYSLKTTLRGHTGSILSLEYADDKKWLFSASGDSTIRIWCTEALKPIYVLNPYLETGAGDLFSLVWSSTLQTIFIGCQNTALQWFDFTNSPIDGPLRMSGDFSSSVPGSGTATPSTRAAHKFFDSYPRHERRAASIHAMNGSLSMSSDEGCVQLDSLPDARATLQVPATNVIDSAHYGYIYCMALLPSSREGTDDAPAREEGNIYLVTGSGDETVNYWECTPSGPSLLHTFDCCHGAVLSLVARGDTVFAGCQDGYVKVWDLETRTLIRELIVQENVDVLSLSLLHSDLYTASADGTVQRWSASFDCTGSWAAHDGIVLSSIITRAEEGFRLVTGANDGFVKLWEVSPPKRFHDFHSFQRTEDEIESPDTAADTIVHALSKFISIPSVSGWSVHKEDCRQAAIWLKKCLAQLGAESTLLSSGDGTNPLVLATFHGAQGRECKRRILFYGHYDVICAPPTSWESDPFILTGKNGYLYGRGATDNKGPIMAVAFAAAELLRRRALGVDLVFLIEGEEECGSKGFAEAVRVHKDAIGKIDSILVSNSTWIAEDLPCITYGLRGVVHCSLEISSSRPDLHSGVEGGAIAEPMFDMVSLLAKLTDSQRRVCIPGFYDHVRQQTEEEKQLYRLLANVTQRPASSLSARWREPSITVHNIEISGPKNATVIPGTVKAQVSLRIVPDQDLDTIANSLCHYLETSFATLQSPNKLEVNIPHKADWWLGNLDDPWFKALESAVHQEWGVEPLRIREGGSIPSIPFLEKEFSCHALHLPLGQSTDQAHLPNERISLSNLRRGQSVVEKFLLKVADESTGSVAPHGS